MTPHFPGYYHARQAKFGDGLSELQQLIARHGMMAYGTGDGSDFALHESAHTVDGKQLGIGH
ncbi:hypothetical protein D3C81_2300890 [compost metagenome]